MDKRVTISKPITSEIYLALKTLKTTCLSMRKEGCSICPLHDPNNKNQCYLLQSDAELPCDWDISTDWNDWSAF